MSSSSSCPPPSLSPQFMSFDSRVLEFHPYTASFIWLMEEDLDIDMIPEIQPLSFDTICVYKILETDSDGPGLSLVPSLCQLMCSPSWPIRLLSRIARENIGCLTRPECIR